MDFPGFLLKHGGSWLAYAEVFPGVIKYPLLPYDRLASHPTSGPVFPDQDKAVKDG